MENKLKEKQEKEDQKKKEEKKKKKVKKKGVEDGEDRTEGGEEEGDLKLDARERKCDSDRRWRRLLPESNFLLLRPLQFPTFLATSNPNY